MKHAFQSLINTHQFATMDHEDPYTYLSTFYELVGTMSFKLGDIVCIFVFVSFFIGKKSEGMTQIPSESKPCKLERCRGEMFTKIFSTILLHQSKVRYFYVYTRIR